MNNIEVSNEYLVALRSTLQDQINQLFGHLPPLGKQKLEVGALLCQGLLVADF